MEAGDFRDKAKEHLRLAKEYFDKSDVSRIPATAVELRMALECIAYQLLASFEDEVSTSLMETWVPSRLIAELKEIDDHIDQDVTMHVGKEEVPGSQAKEMLYLGTANRPSATWVKRNYNALGSFVHERTIAQHATDEGLATDAVIERLTGCIKEVERVLSANLWGLNLRVVISVTCFCGFKVTRRESLLEKKGRLTCANCGEVIRATKKSEGWDFFTYPVKVKCPHADCLHTQEVAEKRIREGEKIDCENCGRTYGVANRLTCVIP